MKIIYRKIFYTISLIYSALLVLLLINTIYAQKSDALKNVFKEYFLMGAALDSEQILGVDKIATPIIKEQFNSITSEDVLKWERIHPQIDQYDFKLADDFVELGEKDNMFIVGHTLVWHQQTPDWVFKDDDGNLVDKETLLKRMKDHISTVVGRYKGKVKGWDVVNEALNEDGTLRQSYWLKIIGDDYLIKAFEFTHQADSDAELYYNDFSLENAPKRNGAVELIKILKVNGVKIDGVGLQGHYKMDWPTINQLDSTIKMFSDLGLKVMITELDVDVLPYKDIDYSADISLNVEPQEELNPYKNGLPDSVQQLLAERYLDLFNVFVNNNEVVSRVTFWGVHDGDSWLNNWPVRGRTNYPLLFDRNGMPKLAFSYVIESIEEVNE